MRLPSRSTTSKRQPRVSTASPVLGKVLELADHQAGDGLVVAPFGQGDPKLIGHFVRRHPAREQPGAVFALHGFGLGFALIGAEGPGDGIEDVGRGDDAVEVAVLVVHERHRDLGLPQHLQGIERIEGVGDDRRLADVGTDVEGLVPQRGGQEFPGLHDARACCRDVPGPPEAGNGRC